MIFVFENFEEKRAKTEQKWFKNRSKIAKKKGLKWLKWGSWLKIGATEIVVKGNIVTKWSS